MSNVLTPYLIQRCTIVRPLEKDVRFSQAARTDYMGSSEFEWGALPSSLRALQSRVADIKMTVETRIMSGEHPLRVLHTLTEAEYEEYFQHLVKLRANKLRLKESASFEPNPTCYKDIDLWWDLDNHVFFSFDKNFMNRLPDHLVTSWKYMDEQKTKK